MAVDPDLTSVYDILVKGGTGGVITLLLAAILGSYKRWLYWSPNVEDMKASYERQLATWAERFAERKTECEALTAELTTLKAENREAQRMVMESIGVARHVVSGTATKEG